MCFPSLYFESWNIKPCLKNGILIDDTNIEKWDGVTHIFVDDWEFVFFASDNKAYRGKIKKGFITDGGSIPRFFRNVINPWGKYAPAFFLHDVFYASECFPRYICDWYLLCCIQSLNGNFYRRNQIYLAVRAGGYFVWKKHKKNEVLKNRHLIELKDI